MNSLLTLLLLLSVVFLLMIFPVKRRPIDFDEKGEAIKIYQEEVAHINRQSDKGFIDALTKKQLLSELDTKSALAISLIEKKSFSYRHSWVPLILIILSLLFSSVIYYQHYQRNGIMRWQAFNEVFHGDITEGLFDSRIVDQFITSHDIQSSSMYCFAMQRKLLAKYDTNPDTLANLASCYLMVGYPQLAEQAIQRGLKHHADNVVLNYLIAELQYTKDNYLTSSSIERLMLVIKMNPNHFKAIRLLAINSLSQGNYTQAKFFFLQLKQLSPKDNKQLLSALDKLLVEIEMKIKETGQVGQEIPLQNSVIHPTLPKTAEKTNKPSLTIDRVPISIRAEITVSPELAKALKEPQTVFLIVKTTEGKLLNATKHILSTKDQQLSVTITDNTEGMMKMGEMTGNQQIDLIARISMSGSPMEMSGDLTSAPLTVILPQDKVAILNINQKLP